MNPRSYDQIYASLGQYVDPQTNLLRQQQSALPDQMKAEEQGLQAKQSQSFDEIVGGARRRGLGFSGIPIQEQAKYNATEYMPALARLHQAGQEKATSLEQAILQLNDQRAQRAQNMYTDERDYSEKMRQFNEQMALERQKAAGAAAAANNNFNPTMGGNQGGGGLPAGMQARTNALGTPTGFNFTVNGKPASAASWATANKVPVSDLLYRMASSGDTTAANAYNWLQRMQKIDPQGFAKGSYKNSPTYKQFSSLFWGA